MKKFIIISAAVLATVATLVLCWFCLTTQVRLEDGETATLTYKVNGKDIEATLTQEETLLVAKILRGKIAYRDAWLSCGFSTDASITIDGVTYCLARDSCGYMQIGDTAKKITLRDSERAEIEAIFEKYGGKFPCI